MPLTGDYEPVMSDHWAHKQVREFVASGGTEATELRGRPIIVLTSVGAKTGKLRKSALMRVEHDGEYAVLGSMGGAPKHPVWVHNLRKQPHVELQDGVEQHDYTARETEGDERELWWKRAVETWPDYDVYKTLTDRVIPVFVLSRRDG
ncbi:nitroreductase family deazaflavin-dependent oxidoreductase [Kutzneria sp. CA-103260]|uniref:nitroreductase family deazaflavin-dependent oxidoreductase n=1 Tax=Kutzneria sp. CA-103260 TaxID=2802641 RepID=UPI001BA452E6|nr:nitroreductase family deazaflavin-dependent oxidoreductase [Kutzneria sp. CA-103260]QUQ72446.1 nitroreductase family deazaflavin-dependent oxidoreductase [Kutzneria sp. CA-103260]